MSVKRLVPLNTVSLSFDPQSAIQGDIYYNNIDSKLKFFNGQSWEYTGFTSYNDLLGKPDLSVYATTSYVDDAISTVTGGGGALRIEQINSSGVVESYYPINKIQFDEDSGFDVINTSPGTAKIMMNSTFKFWQINGTQALTAEGLDTLNLTSSDGIIISASSSTDPKSINFTIDSSKVSVLDEDGNVPLSQLGNVPVKTTVKILSSAPSSPSDGDLWMKSDTGSLYVYDGQFWAETSGSSGFGVSISTDAPSNPSTGSLWVDSSTGITYTYDGMYWFEM